MKKNLFFETALLAEAKLVMLTLAKNERERYGIQNEAKPILLL